MGKLRPFSKIKKNIDSFFDEKLNMEMCCLSYPIRSQYGSSSIPRFYLKLGKEYIWDFPKDFEIKKHFHEWVNEVHISELVRDYIDEPVDKLLRKEFEKDKISLTDHFYMKNRSEDIEIELKLTELFKAADRRLGKEKLLSWAKEVKNPLVDRILAIRFEKP
jgi:hypothetical protein